MSVDHKIAYGMSTVRTILSLQDGPGEPAALNTELFNLSASPTFRIVAHTHVTKTHPPLSRVSRNKRCIVWR